MRRRYSIYEAKARLSEIIRDGREGHSAAIAYHGEPVAEIRPYSEAEFRAAFRREEISEDPTPLLQTISWIHLDRPLSEEIRHVLAAGALCGADLLHLACALFLDPGAKDIAFATLDSRQREVGRATTNKSV